MTESQTSVPNAADASRGQLMSARFAGMVLQQTNMALMLLGKVAHPESGQTMLDLDSARMFIDQLEMLEFKTKGNLSSDEGRLLSQSLTSLRLAFVEAADQAPKEGAKVGAPAPEPSPEPALQSPPVAAPAPAEPNQEDSSSRKKYSKSYGEG